MNKMYRIGRLRFNNWWMTCETDFIISRAIMFIQTHYRIERLAMSLEIILTIDAQTCILIDAHKCNISGTDIFQNT